MFDRLSLDCNVLCKAKVGLLDTFVKLFVGIKIILCKTKFNLDKLDSI